MYSRRGFTLIELLVTITIIGMLAAMILFGLVKAQTSARVARTKSTITKLDGLLRRRWDSYRTRRVPVSTVAMNPSDAADLRLVALRQLMRMEMPDTWQEVVTGPTALQKLNRPTLGKFGGPFSPSVTMVRPALSEAYLRYYNTVSVGKTANGKPTAQFQNAECLYMIITLGAMDALSGREMFSETEIGDVDNDGAPEFIDAWGMPIRFLRWPVGFIDDPVYDAYAPTNVDLTTGKSQPVFGHLSSIMVPKVLQGTTPQPQNYAASYPGYYDASFENNHDPLDVRHRDGVAFKLYPLIYSAGPDRIEDIYTGLDTDVRDDPYADFGSNPVPWSTNADDPNAQQYNPLGGVPAAGTPGALLGIPCDLNSYRFGVPENANGVLNHYDNITNHQLDTNTR